MQFSWFGIPSTLLLFTLGSSLMADDTARSVEGGSKRRRWGRVGAVEFGGAHGFTSATWHNRGLRP